jgi:2',3'-cyclic-nucleotide 2'-phosphodiesterase (5'-nucleotidase family)
MSVLIAAIGMLAVSVCIADEPGQTQPAGVTRGMIKKSSRETKAPPKPTAPLAPVTEQLIPAGTLAKDQTGTLLILHHNDLHDGIKPRPRKLGGMAYIGGYVKSARAQRPDMLVLNAGDTIQNSHGGDYMGLGSKGEASFRALGASGCDITVMGDHDFVFGLAKLQENLKAAGVTMVTAGVTYQDTGEPVFPEFLIRQVGDVKVGIIGATRKYSYGVTQGTRRITGLDPTALFKRVDELARMLEGQVDLTVVVYHEGTYGSKLLAAAAPMVDVVVCGHDNEVTQTPMKADTGALVVNMGGHGTYVGSIDMVVDKTRKQIGKYTFEVIPIDRKKLDPDPELEKEIVDWDRKWGTKPAARPDTNTVPAVSSHTGHDTAHPSIH